MRIMCSQSFAKMRCNRRTIYDHDLLVEISEDSQEPRQLG